MHNKSDFIASLKKHGLKVTDSRVAILNVLQHTDELLTADEIFDRVNRTVKSDRATVYRTVSTYAQVGLIEAVQLKDSSIRYEIAHKYDHHHHAVCTTCGVVEHIADESVEEVLRRMTKKLKKFSGVDEHALEFFGTCKKCATTQKSA